MPRRLLHVLLYAAGLFGADPPANDNPFFIKTTVVVTATRGETDLAAAPTSVGVVEKRELRLRNIQLLDQSLDLTEGVQVTRTKGPADTLSRVLLRGFTGQARTLVLLDGMPLNDAYSGEAGWGTLPVGEVDRVEVARGPFSSLYGGNAMGGVIHILTRPVERREVEVSGQYGSQDTALYSARFSDRLWNRLGLTLGYQRLQSGGYPSRMVTATPAAAGPGVAVTGASPTFTSTGGRAFLIGDGGNNWYNQHAWRARGEYTISASTVVSGQYIRQSYGYGYDAYNTYLRDTAGNPVDRGSVLVDGSRLSITPLTFQQGPGEGLSHFVNGRVQHKFTERAYLLAYGGLFDQPSNNFLTPGLNDTGTVSERASRAYHANAQINWQRSPRHDLLVGAETRRDQSVSQEYGLPARAQSYYAGGRSFNQAAYAQDQIRVTERLQVVAGGRLDYWKTFDGANDLFRGDGRTAYPERSQSAATGKLAAGWQAPRDWNLRASVGTAFRNPNVLELYRTFRLSTGTLFVANPALEPERLVSFELGARKRLGERLELDGAFFRNQVTDLVYRKTDFAVDPAGRYRVNVNAGAGSTNGVELGARQRLAGWLQLRATYTYTDARITRNEAAPDTAGKRVPNIPGHMASAGLLASRRKWNGSLTGRYSGAVFSSDINNDRLKGVPGSYDPFLVFDASFTYQLHRHAQLFSSAENLLNRRFYLSSRDPGRLVFFGLRLSM